MKPTRVYQLNDLIVEWRPEKCVHCQICVTTLPDVFQLDRRPWVDLSQSSPEKIRETVAMCPDGALSIPEKIQDIN